MTWGVWSGFGKHNTANVWLRVTHRSVDGDAVTMLAAQWYTAGAGSVALAEARALHGHGGVSRAWEEDEEDSLVPVRATVGSGRAAATCLSWPTRYFAVELPEGRLLNGDTVKACATLYARSMPRAPHATASPPHLVRLTARIEDVTGPNRATNTNATFATEMRDIPPVWFA